MGTLVFCDIEGTLISGSLAGGFVRAGREMKLFPARRMAVAQFYTLLAKLLPSRAPELRWQALLKLLAGLPRDVVECAGRAGMPDLQARLKPGTMARLREHQRNGDMVILISGGLHDAARVIAAEIGVDAGEGTQPELHDGTYTGRVGGGLNHGPAKARRARQIAQARGIALVDCIAYGDSGADIPLLNAVGRAVAVDPDPALRAAATMRGWEILRNTTR